MLKNAMRKKAISISFYVLAICLLLINVAKAQSLNATFEDGRVLVQGESGSFECVPDYTDYGSMATIGRFYSPFSVQEFSGGTSVSIAAYDEYISCASPGSQFGYFGSYSGGLLYDDRGPEPVCIMSGSPTQYAGVVVPQWPEVTVTSPGEIVSGVETIQFSYHFFTYYNSSRRVSVNVGHEMIYLSGDLPVSGNIELTYDFSNKKEFVLLQFRQICGGHGEVTEKLVYVDPEDSCEDKVGKPVGVASGKVYTRESDFSLKGTAPLIFTRYYDSAETTNRDFGKSWSHAYDTRVVPFPGSLNIYTVIDPGGSNVYYVDNDGDKVYEVEYPKGEYSLLIKNTTDGTFVREYADGRKEEFNSQGYLTAMEERNGNRITITRTLNMIETITGPFGREIAVTYDAGKISAVTLPDNREITYDYYTSGYLKKVTYPDLTFREYEYVFVSGVGYRLSGIKNEKGAYVEKHTYDILGRAVTSSADGSEELLTINYIDRDTSTVTDSLGRQTTYTIDKTLGKSHPTNISGPGCRECGQSNISRTYDNNLNVTSQTDANGNITTMTYDVYGNMLTRTEATGTAEERTTTYTYNAFGQVLTSTDNNGNRTTYTYDLKGNLTEEVDAQDNVTTHTYGVYNEKLSSTDRNGNTTTYTYDQYGNLATIINELNQTTSYTYDIMGNQLSMTDPNGNTSIYEYDSRDRLIKEIRQDGGEIIYEYDTPGNRTAATDANGNRTTFTYDALNRLVTTTDAEGNSTNNVYDTEGNIISVIIKNSSDTVMTSTTNTYDDHNRLLRVTHSDGTYTEQSYDALGNVLTRRDENGNITTNTYDALSRLISVTDPAGGVTSYTYDSRDNLLTVTDANSNTTTYAYDSLNRLMSIISPDTGTTTYTYDPNGNMLTKTDANGITITYVYDELNRQSEIQFPDSAQNITYAYDETQSQNGTGKLTTMTDPSGSTTYDYDTMGRITRELINVSSLNYSIEYAYDLEGNIVAMTYPGGRVTAYTYNQTNKISSVSETFYGSTIILADNITYLPFGDMISMTQGNNIVTTKIYDSRYQMSGLNIGSMKNLSYTRDNNGNITDIKDNISPANTKSYTYDNLYRLTLATGQWGTITYAYDSAGNRTYETTDTGTTAYNYAAGTNRLTSSSGEKELNFNYDNDGNTSGENTRQYFYNQNQRLIQAVEGSNILGEYIYNGNGQRVRKLTDNGSQCRVYHYDKDGLLIAKSSSAGTIRAEYIYINRQPLAKIEGEKIYYYHNDNLGAPMLISDGDKNVVWQGEYLPFGESYSVTGSVINNLRFAGQYYDAETGLHYNYFRDYKPEVSRYIEADPSGINKQAKSDLYVYVANNPINFVDPLGLLTCGSGWNEPFVPDNPFGYQFSDCCQGHDDCYGSCRSNKGQCDNDFESCMLSACENVEAVNREHCRRLARIYSGAVRRHGGSAYNNAQKNNCDC